MEIECTATRICLLRSLTWAGGSTEQLRTRVRIRDKIETQAGDDLAEAGFDLGRQDRIPVSPLPGTFVIDLTSAELQELTNALSRRQWADNLPRSLVEEIIALPDWLRRQIEEAKDYESVQRLSPEKRRKLMEEDA